MKRIFFWGIIFFSTFSVQAAEKNDPVVACFKDQCKQYNLCWRWVTDYFYTMTVDQFIQAWPYVVDCLFSTDFTWDYFAKKENNKELFVSRIGELIAYTKHFFEKTYVDLETKQLVPVSVVLQKNLKSVVLLEKFCISNYSLFWVTLQDRFYAKTIDQLLQQFDRIVTRTDQMIIGLVLTSEILATVDVLVRIIKNPLIRNKYIGSLELNRRVARNFNIKCLMSLKNEHEYGG